mgnify:CR=1 FL=1
MINPSKNFVFVPYWLQHQIERGGLSQDAYASYAKLRTVASDEDIASMPVLTSLMRQFLGIGPLVKIDRNNPLWVYDNSPFFDMEGTPFDWSVAPKDNEPFAGSYECIKAYFPDAQDTINSRLLGEHAVGVGQNKLPTEYKQNPNDFHGYVIRDLTASTYYVTVYPGYFGTVEGFKNLDCLRRDMVKNLMRYKPYHEVAHTELFRVYYSTL